MNTSLILHFNRLRSRLLKGWGFALVAVLTLAISLPTSAQVAQVPLFLGGGGVPGSLALVPSVEWPTINSVANLGDYTTSRAYAGYFDPNKCYAYHYSSTESERHFYPVSSPTGPNCPGAFWSGNFLNWAATQTVDPFRSALTGGYRVKDTPTETWLEKARHTAGQGGSSIYPNRRIPDDGNDSALLNDATPFNANWMRMRIEGLGNKMRFRLNDDGVDTSVTAYDPSQDVLTDRAYEVSIRVKVCVPGLLEDNCRQYAQGWKPEGTLQEYSADIRYSIFGFLNDHGRRRDGGVMRARQKFIGPTLPGVGGSDNPHKEWDPVTGVLLQNPNPDDATATDADNIAHSGVINYLNRFGQMTPHNHKSTDPVSELYYAALRYFRNLGDVPEYSDLSIWWDGDESSPTSTTQTDRYRLADGFPVITDWDDPIDDWCQRNVILGIGDIYTHRDKNLPGRTRTNDEPDMPPLVAADTEIDVHELTRTVSQLEGFSSTALDPVFTDRENSAYIAGLAYWANTQDIRPESDEENGMPGKQTVSTYWVDVLEAQSLEGMQRNQYALATKYGGFKVPPDYKLGDPLEEEWWHTSGVTLTPFGSRGAGQPSFKKPDNFYVAGEADQMVDSLTEAFATIFEELRASSASSVATNSTRIDTDTLIYQAKFDSSDWSGQLVAFEINADGSVGAVAWDTDNAGKIPAHASRNIFTYNNGGVAFTWASLNTGQQDLLAAGDLTVGENRLNWIRGDQSQEGPNELRIRERILGDIVNSDPFFVAGPRNEGYASLPDGTPGKTSYADFLDNNQSRTPMLYVGANDGMLHAFQANTGVEQFAYVPNSVFPNLAQLTDPAYDHRYYVDGSPFVGDAYIGGGWKSVLIGTLGAGGPGVFALDVTNPTSFGASNVLWDITSQAGGDFEELGAMVGQIGRPIIGRMQNGVWAAIFGNGYDSGHGAHLFIVNLANGNLIKKIAVDADPESANGLSAPALIFDSTRTVVGAYAGDLKGNLWKFDLLGNAPSSWGIAFSGTPLFTAKNDDSELQPITAPLRIATHPDGGRLIFFGTGSFYKLDDRIDQSVQSFYGIRDTATLVPDNGNLIWSGGSAITPTDRNSTSPDYPLVEQKLLDELTLSGNNWRIVSRNPINWSIHRGWYIDLISPTQGEQGERVISAAQLRSGQVIFTTLISTADEDPCIPGGGTSWIMAVDMFTGGRSSDIVFDVDGDGEFDEADMVNIGTEEAPIYVPPSGYQITTGIVRSPALLSDDAIIRICTADTGGGDVRCAPPGNGNGNGNGNPSVDARTGRLDWRQLR